MQFIQNIDDYILNFIQAYMRNPIMDKIMPIITNLGDGGLVWITIALILIISRKSRKYGYILIISLVICSLVGDVVLKHLVERVRPFKVNSSIQLLISSPKSFSFPSGHTMASFTSATVIFKIKKKLGIIAFILASAIGFSRLYLYVHYPSDVLVGGILGILCGTIVYNFLINNKIINKNQIR